MTRSIPFPVSTAPPSRARAESDLPPPAFLTIARARPRDVRRAVLGIVLSLVIFAFIAPFAAVPLAPVAAFIPAYESALVICDLITAALLCSQVRLFRSQSLGILAGGYLFTAAMAFMHVLSFPGVFTDAGLLGGGSQTTVWLYVLWHLAFPVFVIAYVIAGTRNRPLLSAPARSPANARAAVFKWALAIGALVGLVVLFAATAENFLPRLLLDGGRVAPALRVVLVASYVAGLVALASVALRKPRTVLDLWLAVVMSAWVIDIALSAGLNGARYDVGWYAGRTYGLFASSCLLIMLLLESSSHYARLAEISSGLVMVNANLEQLSREDGLTHLANRRSFDEYLAQQIAVARRFGRTLALILCDVDAFKSYNDRYGHLAGDECLRRIAAAMQSCCRRPADMVARYGGEEFAMILPDTTLEGAVEVAEAIRAAVVELGIPHEASSTLPLISVSGGVVALTGKLVRTAEQLFEAADKTLYVAKFLGRNRMVPEFVEAG